MVIPEIFDAYDEFGNKLGIDLTRGNKVPKGLYHFVVEIYTLNQNFECLVTLRDDKKYYPHFWEITAGAVLKGETPIEAAKRELFEETGLDVSKDHLKELFVEKHESCFIYGFIHQVNALNQAIQLQPDETIDYLWVPLNEMKTFVLKNDFVPTCSRRFILYLPKMMSLYQIP